MGNCIEKFEDRTQEVSNKPLDEDEMKPDKGKNDNMRIKIVLTKEELEWLMLQLENGQGKTNVEDVLVQIQRNRDKNHVTWKPSLDSIIENPEVPDGMDR